MGAKGETSTGKYDSRLYLQTINGFQRCIRIATIGGRGGFNATSAVSRFSAAGDRAWLSQSLLDHVVEGAEPVVDHHVELDPEPDEEDEDRRHANGPAEPAMRQQPADQSDEDGTGDDHVLVEPDVARRLDGDSGPVGVDRRIGKADQTAEAEPGAEVACKAVPEGHADRGP